LRSSSSTSRTRRRSEGTASFVCELPLRVPLSLGRQLAAKLEAARQTYNACLGEVLRRLWLVRQSVWFARGKATPRQRKQERQAHFRAARAARVLRCGDATVWHPVAEQGRDGGEDVDRRAPRGA